MLSAENNDETVEILKTNTELWTLKPNYKLLIQILKD